MKTLLLLRHAKSSWGDDSLADYDRPLNDRGRHDAPRMGQLLASLDLVPQLIVSSAAVRAQKTARLVARAAGYEGDIRLTNELYLADPETFITVASETEDTVERLMLVGHNPGIEELVAQIGDAAESMPTAALACFHLSIDHWSELTEDTRAELAGVWRPKEL